MLVCGVLAAGCTTTPESGATAPPTTVTTATSSTTTPPPTSTVTLAPTTTVDRVAEIAAIFEDIERRRLQAIYDQDEEAFLAVFANEEYAQRSMVAFDTVQVVNPNGDFKQLVVSVRNDSDTCLAAEIQRNHSEVIQDGAESIWVYVAEQFSGVWGLSWVGLEWECDRPHPLS